MSYKTIVHVRDAEQIKKGFDKYYIEDSDGYGIAIETDAEFDALASHSPLFMRTVIALGRLIEQYREVADDYEDSPSYKNAEAIYDEIAELEKPG